VLLLILLIVIIFGFGGYWGGNAFRPGYGLPGGVVLVLVVLLILYLLGYLRG
jgi:hypothetical protein